MSSKKNPLANAALNFNSVSKQPDLSGMSKKTVDDKINVKSNDDIKVKSETKSILDEVPDFNEKEKKRPLTVYLEPDVWQALDDFAKPKGKGAKSEAVEKLLKRAFDLN